MKMCASGQVWARPSCDWPSPNIAPNGEHIWIHCGSSYLIELRTFLTQAIPDDHWFINWSPDSRYALLARTLKWEINGGEYVLLPTARGQAQPVANTLIRSPAWSPDGAQLAYLSEDGKAVVTLEPDTRASRLTLLSQPSVSVVWSPHGDSLAVLAEDGSLWWIPDPAIDYVEQLTPPLSNVRDVRWSPSGVHLALISGNDVYVVAAAIAGP